MLAGNTCWNNRHRFVSVVSSHHLKLLIQEFTSST
jgi:hypothetical protein